MRQDHSLNRPGISVDRIRSQRTRSRPVIVALLTAMITLLPLMSPLAPGARAAPPGNEQFQRTWARTDQPVAELLANRTWMWGPQGNTPVLTEQYLESPGGERQVQYFDKSRMEITNPAADPNSTWYVTNGLLVVELMTGQMQTGDTTFEAREPAQVNVAGDSNDPTGPTYATFAMVTSEQPLPFDQPITQRIDRAGNVTSDPTLASFGVEVEQLDPVTNHAIAGPFWAFMNSEGVVYEDGQYIEDKLFENASFATGRPVTEAYWAEVRVAGTPKPVLIQCFERRCLTYTPDNPDGWQVESGNVGQHYYQWRYEQVLTDAIVFVNTTEDGTEDGDSLYVGYGGEAPFPITDRVPDIYIYDPQWSPGGARIAFTKAGYLDPNPGGPGAIDQFAYTIHTVQADGGDEQRLDVAATAYDGEPAWSPDGTRIAFVRTFHALSFTRHGDIYLMNADGSEAHSLTSGFEDSVGSLAWSPDGSQIAFYASRRVDMNTVSDHFIYVMNADGTGAPRPVIELDGRVRRLSWSPDGDEFLFVFVPEDDPGGPTIAVVSTDGTTMRQIKVSDLELDGWTTADWSPDGEQILFSASGADDSGSAIYVMDSDGTNPRRLFDLPGDDRHPDW